MAETIGVRLPRAAQRLLRVAGVAVLAMLAAGEVAPNRVEAASADTGKATPASTADAAAIAATPALASDIASLRDMIEAQQQQLEAQQRQIEYLQHALTEVREVQAKAPLANSDVQLPVAYRAPVDDNALAQSRATGIATPRARSGEPTGAITMAAADTAEATTQGERETVGERPPEEKKAPPELPAIADLGGVLTPRGVLSLEPQLTASRTSTARFLFRGVEILPAFLVGVIEVSEADRNYVSPSITARYGITDRLEASVSVPYVYRSDTIKQSGATLGGQSDTRDVEGHGIGDVDVGLQYQINKGNDDWPIMVANMRGKFPTGTGPFDVPRDPSRGLETELPTGSGFFGVQPSLTVIQAMDPLVFYGNASYLVNLSRNINQTIPLLDSMGGSTTAFIGKVDPGDALGFSFGGALAITENVSVSLGYDHYYVFGTKQQTSSFDSMGVPGPLVSSKSRAAQVGTLNFGVNFRNDKGRSFSVTLGAGLTDDAQDVSITLRRPLSWHIGP